MQLLNFHHIKVVHLGLLLTIKGNYISSVWWLEYIIACFLRNAIKHSRKDALTSALTAVSDISKRALCLARF